MIKVIRKNGKHYIFDTEEDDIICIEDTLKYLDFANKLAKGELTGTLKFNRILRQSPN